MESASASASMCAAAPVVLSVKSVNFAPLPTEMSSVECLWVLLHRPAPTTLRAGMPIVLVSTDERGAQERVELAVEEVAGARVVLRHRVTSPRFEVLVPSATAEVGFRAPQPHVYAAASQAGPAALRKNLPTLGRRGDGETFLLFSPPRPSAAAIRAAGDAVTAAYASGSGYSRSFQLF
jgi:hypothetical protein